MREPKKYVGLGDRFLSPGAQTVQESSKARQQCGAGRWRLIRNTRRCRASISAADVTSEAPRVEGVFSPTSFGRQRIEIMSAPKRQKHEASVVLGTVATHRTRLAARLEQNAAAELSRRAQQEADVRSRDAQQHQQHRAQLSEEATAAERSRNAQQHQQHRAQLSQEASAAEHSRHAQQHQQHKAQMSEEATAAERNRDTQQHQRHKAQLSPQEADAERRQHAAEQRELRAAARARLPAEQQQPKRKRRPRKESFLRAGRGSWEKGY